MRLINPKSAVMLGVAILCVCFATSARAESDVLTVDPNDTPLRISGILDGLTTSFSGNVRLTVTGSDVDKLQFLASDLHHATEPATLIDRSNVTVPSSFSLKNGQPSDIRVTVSNVKQAGVYSGTLQFLLPGLPFIHDGVISLCRSFILTKGMIQSTSNGR